MTFQNAPSAINGAQLGAALVRRATFAAIGEANGVVLADDLKVSELDTPGVGVQIAAGVGVVLNDYQTLPNELYVVSNPGTHTIPSGDMPASDPSIKHYILAIVIGDPDFSQVGHPWMGADDPEAGDELIFEYVRPTFIEVSAGVTELDVDYPALVLARLDIPASTTTILDSHIVDLRHLARPRQSQEIFPSPPGTWSNASPRRIPSGAVYGDWGPQEFEPSVTIPVWAKRAIVVASINGIRLADTTASVSGNVRVQLGAVVGPVTTFDYSVGGGAIRDNLQCAGEYDVSAIAGTTVTLVTEGYQSQPASPTTNQKLALQTGSQVIYDVRFFQE